MCCGYYFLLLLWVKNHEDIGVGKLIMYLDRITHRPVGLTVDEFTERNKGLTKAVYPPSVKCSSFPL